ncbi:methanol oxidation system protein MoxJ [Ancylobacter crimeensis]
MPASRRRRSRSFTGTAAAALALALLAAPAWAANAGEQPAADAAAPARPGELRICASNVEAPFSEKGDTGFEDRIAQVLAEAMGRKAVFVRSDRPGVYMVRDMLDANSCDVVMGVDAGDERVATSKPYYRTGYVLVTRTDRNITANRWDDPKVKEQTRFALRFYSPAEAMVKRLGRYEDNAAYMYSLVNFVSRRNQWVQVPGDRLVSEVAKGDADVAIAFAPEVARYVKTSTVPLTITVMADDFSATEGGPKIPLHYDQSIGVRKDDTALLGEINAALEKARPQIDKILSDEGIPVLKPNS